MQGDPIGYSGGMNLYGYVANDPVNATDPTGTEMYDLKIEGQTTIDDTVSVFGTRPPTPFFDTSAANFNLGSLGGFAGVGFTFFGGGASGDGNDDHRCDTPLPDGSTVRENVAFVENIIFNSPRDPEGMDVPYLVAVGTFVGSVAPGGPWDYKLQTPGRDEMGNFNFGETGSVLLSPGTLLRGAGAVQFIQNLIDPRGHPYRPEYGNPFGELPRVGDVPEDVETTLAGINQCR